MIIVPKPKPGLITNGFLRMLRGGGWRSPGMYCCQAGNRQARYVPIVWVGDLGFRIVMRRAP